MPDFSLEDECGGLVAGVDEAGRGPWAGPVISAAVILPRELGAELKAGLDDSKKLTSAKRASLYTILRGCADIGIGGASVAEIECQNILGATLVSMARAIAGLDTPPQKVLVDGNHLPNKLACPGKAIVKGDGISLSIAAASVVAKVTRDKIMSTLALRYPVYGWENNAGYGTRQHQRGLSIHGISPHHRRSFAPIFRIINP
ncbi:MAG: ribonuclease HII [Pseudomonadota bacterium]|nr:ribonuclease HII [Pseudomonadota bacterium]